MRLFIAFVASRDLKLHQIDLRTAFLNGNLTNKVYMKHPKRFGSEVHPDDVCELQKPLYSLHQAAHKRNAKVDCLCRKGSGFRAVLAILDFKLKGCASDLCTSPFMSTTLCSQKKT